MDRFVTKGTCPCSECTDESEAVSTTAGKESGSHASERRSYYVVCMCMLCYCKNFLLTQGIHDELGGGQVA